MHPCLYSRIYGTTLYPYIHGYLVASFQYFNGTGSVYTFVSVNRRNNEAQAHCNVGPRFIIPSICRYKTEPVPLKHGKLATKYIRTFLQCYRRSNCVIRHLMLAVQQLVDGVDGDVDRAAAGALVSQLL